MFKYTIALLVGFGLGYASWEVKHKDDILIHADDWWKTMSALEIEETQTYSQGQEDAYVLCHGVGYLDWTLEETQ